ncbi:uncharacterized protein LTR77_008735 [Saxophila tyrrhenica]|uniref:Uncharacterized protein n=1 Tax=Saxophila tyrrhenica TaxID=1690608 RepID=A0AAV9P053_9PEZI|nr:hypothetical protein LTR77_008735 [Saxophila tyrrhenica]
MSSTGSDAKISGTKIEPLDSTDTKQNQQRDMGGQGVAGSDKNIDQARIGPVGGKGVGQNPAPHDDVQGVVGRDANVEKVKIDPLVSQAEQSTEQPAPGLNDENVSAARVAPLGEVREDMPQNQ